MGDIEPYYNCDFEDQFLVVTPQRYKLKAGMPVPYDIADRNKLSDILESSFGGLIYIS